MEWSLFEDIAEVARLVGAVVLRLRRTAQDHYALGHNQVKMAVEGTIVLVYTQPVAFNCNLGANQYLVECLECSIFEGVVVAEGLPEMDNLHRNLVVPDVRLALHTNKRVEHGVLTQPQELRSLS